MRFRVLAWLAAGVGAPALASAQTAAPDPAVVPVAGDSLFEFRSDFWYNLHHFLYAQMLAEARHRAGDTRRSASAPAREDTAGLGTLPADQRGAWARALTYYDSAFGKRSIGFDSLMREINNDLAGYGAAPLADRTRLPAGLAAVLDGAAPAYRARWWPAHDRANRAWVATLAPMLQQHGRAIATRLARIYRTPWSATPNRVEVVAYANWAGAYTSVGPTLLTMSSLYQGHRGSLGLEQAFHEASHAMTDTLDAALAAAAKARRKDPDEYGYGFSHPLIFYTVGDVVERAVPGHTAFAKWRDLWSGRWGRYHKRIVVDWQPYLDGKIAFEEAIERLVAGLGP